MFRRTLWALAAIALLAPVASAQKPAASAPTVDEIIAKHVEARGGMEKLKAVKTTRETGKMIMPQGMELPFTVTAKRPNSSRMEFSVQGMTGLQVCDGTTAWSVMPFMGKKDPEAMSPEDTKSMIEQADFDGPLVDWKAKGTTVELLGKEKVEGADAYKLKVTTKSGNVRTMYLDAESYLEVKVDSKRTMQGMEIQSESFLTDYREEGGMMMAHSVETRQNGAPEGRKMTIDKVELNVDIPDSQFAMPKPAAADTSKAVAGAPAGAAPVTSAMTAPAADSLKTDAKVMDVKTSVPGKKAKKK